MKFLIDNSFLPPSPMAARGIIRISSLIKISFFKLDNEKPEIKWDNYCANCDKEISS